MNNFTSKSTLKRKAAQTPNTYHWMIDGAYGACSNESLPIHGPDDCDADEAFGPSAKRFLMLDDDGNIYYGGLIQGTDYQGFEPLDDYGTPNAGASEIRYINADGGWEQL